MMILGENYKNGSKPIFGLSKTNKLDELLRRYLGEVSNDDVDVYSTRFNPHCDLVVRARIFLGNVPYMIKFYINSQKPVPLNGGFVSNLALYTKDFEKWVDLREYIVGRSVGWLRRLIKDYRRKGDK